MTQTHHHGDTAADWDARYAEQEQRWSGHPNASLLAAAADLTPGTALDVGCGEGADAIWLARQGWTVTGIDISTIALERCRAAADAAGVSIALQLCDLTTDQAPGRFDLVSLHYPALPAAHAAHTIAALLAAVAPGGRLLVVGHSPEAICQHRADFDPTHYLQPPQLARALGANWTVEVNETRPRVTPPGYTGPDVPDVVLLARRTG
jgi:SAM-dependent methyltransferase